MVWLPHADVLPKWVRWPLAEPAAELFARLLLGIAEEPRREIANCLRCDPALVLWAMSLAESDGAGSFDTVDDVASWLADAFGEAALPCGAPRASRWFLPPGEPRASEPSHSCDDDSEAVSDTRCRAAELAHECATVARRADELAGSDCRLSAASELLGLVHNAGKWLRAFTDESGAAHQSPLSHALRQRLQLLQAEEPRQTDPPRTPAECVRAAIASPSLESDEQDHLAEQVQAYWMQPVGTWSQMLPALAARLTRLGQLEQRFEKQLEEEKLAALGELAAGAGHELNNPLAVISGRAQLMLRGEDDPDRRRALSAIDSQALRVHEMISDLMLFARPPALTKAAVDLPTLVARLVAEHALEAHQRGIDLAIAATQPRLAIVGDETQLEIALAALLRNSFEAIGADGAVKITVGTSPDGAARASESRPRMAHVQICDDGPGIAPEVRRHLFDPFFSGRAAGRGLGFGLTKCWRIIRDHGGTIEVADAPAGGALFTVRLPQAESAAETFRATASTGQ